MRRAVKPAAGSPTESGIHARRDARRPGDPGRRARGSDAAVRLRHPHRRSTQAKRFQAQQEGSARARRSPARDPLRERGRADATGSAGQPSITITLGLLLLERTGRRRRRHLVHATGTGPATPSGASRAHACDASVPGSIRKADYLTAELTVVFTASRRPGQRASSAFASRSTSVRRRPPAAPTELQDDIVLRNTPRRERAPALSPSRPGLAFGSFLNVVDVPAARRPLGRPPALGLPVVRHADRAARQHPGALVPSASRALQELRHAIGWQYPAVELLTALLVAACVPRVRAHVRGGDRRVLLHHPRGGLGDRHRALRHPEPHRPSCRRRRARRADDPRAVARVGDRRLRRARSSSWSPRSRIPPGWGWATSSSRSCSASCWAAPFRSRLMIGFVAALVPAAVLLARHGSAARKMRIPFGPFLALGGIVALFWGDRILDAYLGLSLMDAEALARAASTSRPGSRPVPLGAARRSTHGFAGSLDDRPAARGAVPSAAGRSGRRGRRPRGDQADPAAAARARLRDPVRVRRRAAADRDHRAAERPRARRAPACDPPLDRVLDRGPRGRPHRAPPAGARVRSAERRADGRRGRAQARQDVQADDLEADDGISDAPLVRLVNSIIFQAAEDGASDIHFEPQGDVLVVRYRIDGVLHVAERIPRAARLRRDHAPEGAGQASTSPSGGSRRTDASRSTPPPPAACSTSASRRCRRSRARP